MEIWKDIVGYEGLYKISPDGLIMSFHSMQPLLLKPYLDRGGYKKNRLVKNGEGKNFSVARLVCTAYHGEPTAGLQVNHKNGVKTDNHESNLEWVTQQENRRHSTETGLVARGAMLPHTKLTAQVIQRMRLLKEITSSITNDKLGKLFQVSRQHAGDIVLEKKWKYVT